MQKTKNSNKKLLYGGLGIVLVVAIALIGSAMSQTNSGANMQGYLNLNSVVKIKPSSTVVSPKAALITPSISLIAPVQNFATNYDVANGYKFDWQDLGFTPTSGGQHIISIECANNNYPASVTGNGAAYGSAWDKRTLTITSAYPKSWVKNLDKTQNVYCAWKVEYKVNQLPVVTSNVGHFMFKPAAL